LYVGIYLHSSDNPAARILQEYAPMKLWGAEQFKDNCAVDQGSGGRKHLQTPPREHTALTQDGQVAVAQPMAVGLTIPPSSLDAGRHAISFRWADVRQNPISRTASV